MPGANLLPLGFPQAVSASLAGSTVEQEGAGFYAFGNDSYWGGREFIYVKAGGAIRQFGVCIVTPTVSGGKYVYTATEAPSTAILGRPIGIAMTALASGEWGWLCIGGVVPVNSNAAVAAAAAIAVAATGQGGASAAGKQITNAAVVVASTQTVAKSNCTGASGSLLIQVPDSDGWFVGAYLSGTGVGAGAKVAAIDPSGRFVTVDVVSTAAISGTVTATYNNATIFYNVCHINRPFMQGAIT